jgi:hypothetical protein
MAKQISTAEESLIIEMHGMLNNLVGKYQTHVENTAIHQLPPCAHHSRLTNRLWGIATLAIGSIVASVWALITKGN